MVEESNKRRPDRTTLDGDLVKRTLKGDNSAFAELVKAYYKIFFSLAFEYVHDVATAEDVLQEGWLEIFRSLRSLRDREKFGSWAYTIMRRKCTDVIYDTKRESKAISDFANEHRVRQKNSGRMDPKHENIVKAISCLPKIYREVAVLYFFEEADIQEISERVGISLSTVYVFIHRAKKMLKEMLKEEL